MISMLFSFQKSITAGFLKDCSFCEIKQTQAENYIQAVHIFKGQKVLEEICSLGSIKKMHPSRLCFYPYRLTT